MNLPERFGVEIITLSDRAYRGEYNDLSGPRIRERLGEFFSEQKWDYVIKTSLIPDDAAMLKGIIQTASLTAEMIFTTGGTGIGPRDITVETVRPMLDKEIPGIMEYIRIRYGADKPNALLSRGVAGIAGNALIYTLPGSLKAVDEYMTEILKTLKHSVMMKHGLDVH
ncbi:MAG TPA: MogA/MoaB family molybdenum cofactor biosynthesis protein [Bacteroidales bacterium]|jgi:molybdenum cofactor synthesis domain-containing protein|nr:MogA/MoaB family molybdenum cofactor biosynthesis protein [Bacteroidales bacterium]